MLGPYGNMTKYDVVAFVASGTKKAVSLKPLQLEQQYIGCIDIGPVPAKHFHQ